MPQKTQHLNIKASISCSSPPAGPGSRSTFSSEEKSCCGHSLHSQRQQHKKEEDTGVMAPLTEFPYLGLYWSQWCPQMVSRNILLLTALPEVTMITPKTQHRLHTDTKFIWPQWLTKVHHSAQQFRVGSHLPNVNDSWPLKKPPRSSFSLGRESYRAELPRTQAETHLPTPVRHWCPEWHPSARAGLYLVSWCQTDTPWQPPCPVSLPHIHSRLSNQIWTSSDFC